MLNPLLTMRVDAISISGIGRGALGPRHGIEAASNEQFGLGDTPPLRRRRERGNQGSKWYWEDALARAWLTICDY
jgi:hypothetical protein